MSLSQNGRLIQIDTPLGPDAFIVLDFTGRARHFNGMIVEFCPGLVSLQEGYSTYRMVILPALWQLRQCHDCRIFQNKSAPDIIAQVRK